MVNGPPFVRRFNGFHNALRGRKKMRPACIYQSYMRFQRKTDYNKERAKTEGLIGEDPTGAISKFPFFPAHETEEINTKYTELAANIRDVV